MVELSPSEVPRAPHIKSQDSKNVTARLDRLKKNSDYLLLNAAQEKLILEMRSQIKAWMKEEKESKNAEHLAEAAQSMMQYGIKPRRLHEGYLMQLNENMTLKANARVWESLCYERTVELVNAEEKITELKRKSNPHRKSTGKIGRPTKVKRVGVFADDAIALSGPPDYRLMDCDCTSIFNKLVHTFCLRY